MATRIYTGDAPAIAQRERITLAGDPGEAADLTATIGRKSITAEAGGEATDDTLATLLQAMATVWNDSELGEFAEVTATTGTLLDGTPYLDLEADTPGVPFEVQFDAPYPTVDVDTLQQGGPGQNEIQQFTIDPAPTGPAPAGGAYTIQWDLGSGVETSAAIEAGASAEAIRNSLVSGMPSLSLADVAVTGTGTADGPCVIELQGALAGTNVAPLTVDTSTLTGDATATLEVVQEGGEPVADTLIVRDTFSAADGTELASRTTDTGHNWQKQSGADLLIQNNRLVHAGDLNATYMLSAAHGADTVIKMQVVLSGDAGPQASRGIWIYVRSTAVDLTGDYLRVKLTKDVGAATFALSIEEWRLGAFTTLATGTGKYLSGLPYDITIRIGGQQVLVDTNLERVAAWYTPVAGSYYGLQLNSYGDHQLSVDSFEIHSSKESDEQWRLFTDAAAGTFTLMSPAGDATGPIAHDASAATLKAALEAIYAGTWTVTGTGTAGDPWIATAGGAMAGTDISEPTIDDTLLSLGYLVDVATLQEGGGASAEQWQVILHGATGGNFQLSVLDQQTADIAFGASAATVQSALETLSPVGPGNVTVSGAGTTGDPYLITLAGDLVGEAVPQLIAHNEDLTGPASITVTQTTLQASRGPEHWDDPLNWIDAATGLAGLPTTGDDVVIEDGDRDRSLKYGLDQSAVKLNSLTISSRFESGAQIGLAEHNDDGGYHEYRETFLQIGLQGEALIEIGAGEGSGSSRINLDTGSDAATIRILQTNGPAADGVGAVNWIGTHAASTLLVVDGFVAVAPLAGQTASLERLTIRQGVVTLGRGATVGAGTGMAIDKTGGELIVGRATIHGTAMMNG
ncbi:hypothetical protein [Maioricimonas sp. JC845]|uniref:hypothetical protein n=1 Tax=Maioricimonas sp. JC845 TaxID=3232138 RepID=UPI00345988CA